MERSRHLKDELRRTLLKTHQFKSKLQEFRFVTFWMSRIPMDFHRRLPGGAILADVEALHIYQNVSCRVVRCNLHYCPGTTKRRIKEADLITASLIRLLVVPGQQPGKNNKKLQNPANTHPNRAFLTGNSTSRPGEGFETGPGPSKPQKSIKNYSFGSAGTAVRPAVIKSAASAASPEVFPSRDPVGR